MTDARLDAVARRFRDAFGRSPEVIAKAPGRVNLIGEHTDYNCLPVLPMAIDRRMLVAAARRAGSSVRLASTDGRFDACEYDAAGEIRAAPAGHWSNYHRAALRGLAPVLGDRGREGGDFLVDSTIPIGAGLSSSAALVVGSALAVLALRECDMPPEELATLTAAAERFVGTESGGMDQAACLLSEEGCALCIHFGPLRVRRVPVPRGATFVVADSLVKAEKSGAARRAYNHRVAECRLVCRVLERALGPALPRPLRHLGELGRLFPERPLSHFVGVLATILPPRPLTLEEIAAVIGAPAERLAAAAGGREDAGETYALLRRGRHVLTEAERVEQSADALAAGDWQALGALMRASHASCRDDYAVSCEELEELVAAAELAGALGSRLTGAGFGGCTISLVETGAAHLFRERIERSYYRRHPAPSSNGHCFVVAPSGGASVVRL